MPRHTTALCEERIVREGTGISVRVSRAGQGAFAARSFKKGEYICRVGGKVFRKSELPTPYDAVTDHYMQVGADRYIGPSGGPDDFLNHSCDPNAAVVRVGKVFYYRALRDIEVGAECTLDYSLTMDEDEWEMDCRCGSPSCRGRVRDFKYLPVPVREKYERLGVVPAYIRWSVRVRGTKLKASAHSSSHEAAPV
jgi:hypothetical protein